MSIETMTKLSTYTVDASGVSSYTFSNIPQTYTDLVVRMSGHLSGTGFGETTVNLTFNSSSTGYSWRSLLTDSSATYSQNGANVAFIQSSIMPASQLSATLNAFGTADMYITGYSSPNYKSVFIDYNEERASSDNYFGIVAGTWSNTAPITSITLTPSSSNFSQYTTFTLYGVKAIRTAVGSSIKATGGAISFDGTYVTHTFNTSGLFTPTQSLIADYLVVAGGGGGGVWHGGGGGAGGLRSTVGATGGGGSLETSLSLIASTSYTVTVGAGGTGGTSNAVRGTSGSNSVFSTITSTGGGGGGSRLTEQSGGNGGSGGGGGYQGAGGTGTTNQGFAGAGDTVPVAAGGGGGGAGVAGAAGTSSTAGGNGGNGVTTSISGSSTTYAGGGGGGSQTGTAGTGGTGGGGAGTIDSTVGFSATANTGGGGGGSGYSGTAANGGNGGSGIVIIRYKA
jgi:hypothetical protein